MRAPTLRVRLFGAFAAVAVIGGVVFAVFVRVLVPPLFDGTMGHNGRGMGGGTGSGQVESTSAEQDTHDAVVDSVNTAMVVALAASLLVATLLAWWLSRRSLRHLDRVRAGTRALRSGEYTTRIPPPPEPELGALAEDINELAGELAASEQRRAALIGDVAHEMRTPLASIAGHMEGFTDGLYSADEVATAIDAEVVRLRRLAEDLAAVSRAEEGALMLDRQRCDVGEVVDAVSTRMRAAFDGKGVSLRVSSFTAPVVADRVRLEQVVSNLLANALAYTPAGGTVDVAVEADSSEVKVAVVDTGRGLAQHELLHVFDRFYRAAPSDRTGGTGVGLTIARAITRAHGGELTATSDGLGKGARFVVSVPR